MSKKFYRIDDNGWWYPCFSIPGSLRGSLSSKDREDPNTFFSRRSAKHTIHSKQVRPTIFISPPHESEHSKSPSPLNTALFTDIFHQFPNTAPLLNSLASLSTSTTTPSHSPDPREEPVASDGSSSSSSLFYFSAFSCLSSSSITPLI